MAINRVAENGKGTNQILVVESILVDCSAQARCHYQTPLAHRARLRRTQTGTWPGAFRRPELARVSPSRYPLHRRLRLPGPGAMPFSPLGRLPAAAGQRQPLSLTPSARRPHAPRRCRQGPRGIIPAPSPPCAVKSLLIWPDLCPDVHAVYAAFYNTVVLESVKCRVFPLILDCLSRADL